MGRQSRIRLKMCLPKPNMAQQLPRGPNSPLPICTSPLLSSEVRSYNFGGCRLMIVNLSTLSGSEPSGMERLQSPENAL